MAIDYKKTMIERFEAHRMPTPFLKSMATTRMLDTIRFEYDSRILKNVYAVDVTDGTGGRVNITSKFTRKEFQIPMYNEYAIISEDDLHKVNFGETEYTQAAVLPEIVRNQVLFGEKIDVAVEKQMSDMFFDGKITLIDGTEINFDKKATHDVAPTNAWNTANGDPIGDILALIEVIAKDSKKTNAVYDLIMATDVLGPFLENDKVQELIKLNEGRITLGDITPPSIQANGATPHGQISVGSYRVNLWTYPQFYEVPSGFGFANEGQELPYIPNGKALLLPMGNVRLELVYGALIDNGNTMSNAMPRFQPRKIRAEKLPWATFRTETGGIVTSEYGLKSRPLVVPIEIDGFATFNSLV